MPAIRLDKFGGMLPAWDDTLLPEGQASLATNAYLYSGALQGWRQPKLLRTLLNSAAAYVFRIPSETSNDTSITATDSKWLEFTDPDTTVIRTPVVSDQFHRYYAASPSQVPKYNTYDRIINDDPFWLLGVPASGCAPGVAVTGGGQNIQLGFSNDLAGSFSGISANTITFTPITPDGNLIISDIKVNVIGLTTTTNLQGAVYTDNNGKPLQLLGTTGIFFNQSVGEVTLAFTTQLALSAGVTYWLALATDKDIQVELADDFNPTVQTSTPNTFSNGLPAFISSGSLSAPFSTGNFQIWADLSGDSVFQARSYVYTWVSAYGEEGPPSPPTLLDGWSNGIWTLTLFSPTAADMGVDRNLTTTRIYRTVTSFTGLSSYFFVAEIPITQLTYVDTSADNVISVGSQLQSIFWSGPPTDLQGIYSLPNGISVGFRQNEIWFSEPYRPHAWPPGYVLTTEFPIVGIGVIGQTTIVCTQGTPYIITGVGPATMAMTKIEHYEPCLYRGSIISTDTLVYYASKNGLIAVSQSGLSNNATDDWITREKWQQLTPQKYLRAIKYLTSYFAFGTKVGTDASVAQTGFTVELIQDATSFDALPQPGGHRLGFCQLTGPNSLDIINLQTDKWTGTALIIQGGAVYYYDFADTAPTIVPFKWRSRVYQALAKKNYSAVRVFFGVPASTPAQTTRVTSDPQPVLQSTQYGILRIYADDQLYTTREIRTSGELLRIYSSKKVERWQFEVEGRVNVSNVQVGTSVKDLATV